MYLFIFSLCTLLTTCTPLSSFLSLFYPLFFFLLLDTFHKKYSIEECRANCIPHCLGPPSRNGYLVHRSKVGSIVASCIDAYLAVGKSKVYWTCIVMESATLLQQIIDFSFFVTLLPHADYEYKVSRSRSWSRCIKVLIFVTRRSQVMYCV